VTASGPLALAVAAGLGLLALVLVGPGPNRVAQWAFLYRVPRAAVVLWQAGSLAALVSVLGAGVLVGVWGFAPGDVDASRRPGWALVLAGLLVAVTVTTALRLAWSLISVARSTIARRRRHRAAVDLLSEVGPRPTSRGLRILAEGLPVAYCLPGLRNSRVVLSSGTLALLDPASLVAVVAHETAHVRARHDLVLDTFTALHRAFPLLVRSALPERECRLLIEMLADDTARRTVGPLPLARALVQLADAPVPATALGAGQTGIRIRVERLAHTTPEGSRSLAVRVYLLAAGLLATPTLLLGLPWWLPA
jgi:bla regulator protein blaR1